MDKSISFVNKWQKLSSLVALTISAIVNYVIFKLSHTQTMYIKVSSIEKVLSDSHNTLWNIFYLIMGNYFYNILAHMSLAERR